MVRPLRSVRAFVTHRLCPACARVRRAARAQDAPPTATAARPRTSRSSRRGRASSATAGPTTAPRTCRCSRGDRLRTADRPRRMLFADGSTLHLDHNTVDRLPVRRAGAAARRARAADDPGPRATVAYRDRRARRLGADHAARRVPRRAADGAERAARSSSRSCAARPSSSNDDGPHAAARRRARVRARRRGARRTPTSSTPRPGTRSIAGRKRGATSGSASRRSTCPRKCGPTRRRSIAYGYWRYEPAYGYVWYPRVAVGWRPYYHGRWASAPPVRLDVDRRRSLGVADASLRPLGLLGRRVVLDSRRARGAPAWVSWAYAPGYVSWCPLGWNNRPVFEIRTSTSCGHGYDPWRALDGRAATRTSAAATCTSTSSAATDLDRAHARRRSRSPIARPRSAATRSRARPRRFASPAAAAAAVVAGLREPAPRPAAAIATDGAARSRRARRLGRRAGRRGSRAPSPATRAVRRDARRPATDRSAGRRARVQRSPRGTRSPVAPPTGRAAPSVGTRVAGVGRQRSDVAPRAVAALRAPRRCRRRSDATPTPAIGATVAATISRIAERSAGAPSDGVRPASRSERPPADRASAPSPRGAPAPRDGPPSPSRPRARAGAAARSAVRRPRSRRRPRRPIARVGAAGRHAPRSARRRPAPAEPIARRDRRHRRRQRRQARAGSRRRRSARGRRGGGRRLELRSARLQSAVAAAQASTPDGPAAIAIELRLSSEFYGTSTSSASPAAPASSSSSSSPRSSASRAACCSPTPATCRRSPRSTTTRRARSRGSTARSGEVVGEFAIQRRVVIPYEAISPKLRQAILAAEDDEFEQHFGLSIPRIIVTLGEGHRRSGARRAAPAR